MLVPRGGVVEHELGEDEVVVVEHGFDAGARAHHRAARKHAHRRALPRPRGCGRACGAGGGLAARLQRRGHPLARGLLARTLAAESG